MFREAAWGAESGHIEVTVQQDVAVVTLHRPEKLNALTAGMRRAAECFFPESSIGLTISNASSVLLPRLAGHAAMRLVLGSARLSADEALAAGLLDEIVGPDGLLEAAIQLVHGWTRPGAPTAAHLKLLRPPLTVIEQAFAAETEAARGVEQAGLSQAGISRFLGRHDDARS
jgi:enoyl-CoA hydratase/carnithine racemase